MPASIFAERVQVPNTHILPQSQNLRYVVIAANDPLAPDTCSSRRVREWISIIAFPSSIQIMLLKMFPNFSASNSKIVRYLDP